MHPRGSNLSTNNPTVMKRNVHISKGPFLMSVHVWSFQYAQCCTQQSSQFLSGFKQSSLPYNPEISFSCEIADREKEFAHFIVIMKHSSI